MTDIYQTTDNSSYSFSSSRYFCTNCNRQFSSIKTDRASTVARCPRCNLYADEISNTQANNTRNTNTQQQSQNIRENHFTQTSSSNNRSPNTGSQNPFLFFINPFGQLFAQPTRQSNMEIETEAPQVFVDPFSAFFGGSAVFPTSFAFFQRPIYDDATIEEFLRNDPNKYGPPPASQESINKLQEVQFNPEGAETNCCPICQEDYNAGENLVKLPCSHEYHKDCVTSWLTKHNSCPMCRKQI